VQAVCAKALYLQKGQVLLAGATNDVIEAYEHDLHQERARKFGTSSPALTNDGGDVEITKVEVWGKDGPVEGPLPSNQSAQIRIHYDAYSDIGKVSMSVFIMRSDGLTCSMMRTKIDGFELELQRGHGVISVHLDPLQLIGGTYFAEAFFLNESDSMVLTPRGGRSDWFSVKGHARSYEESSGVYEPIAQWRHQFNGLQATYSSDASEPDLRSAEANT
jgi:hypothetical protein